MDKNNNLLENNNINLLKGNIKKYFQKLENNNINLLKGNIKKYFQKLENNNILYEQVQPLPPAPPPPSPAPPVPPVPPLPPSSPSVPPSSPPVPPAENPPSTPLVPPSSPPLPPSSSPLPPVPPDPPVENPAQPSPELSDEEYLVFNIDENKIIKICNNNNDKLIEEFINDYKHFVQENIVEEIKIGREIISKKELKQKINNVIINNAYIIKIKKQIYELYDLDDKMIHSYISDKNNTRNSINDLLISNSQPINNINMILKINQDSENYYFAEYINRFSLSWTKPYLIIVDVILREEYKNYIN